MPSVNDQLISSHSDKLQQMLELLHGEIIRSLLATGKCPTNDELAERLGVDHIQALLQGLAEMHGIVLHPHEPRPWVIHPFSLTPTLNYVVKDDKGWWAPCIWCALGIAALAGGDVKICTREGGEEDSLVLAVKDGVPQDSRWLVHFSIPPREAWNNVHEHCALVLPFSNESGVDKWLQRHGGRKGQVVPINQVAHLARRWYGTHASPDWHKWSIEEAQQIFTECGLTGDFWNLQTLSGTY
jgi:hypothetical protein